MLEPSHEKITILVSDLVQHKPICAVIDQNTIGPENAHLKPLVINGAFNHNEMTLTLNLILLLTSLVVCIFHALGIRLQ